MATLVKLFPVWLILASAAGLIWPTQIVRFGGPNTTVFLLATVMLGMGLTLTFKDFRRIANKKRAVGIGFFAQFAIMPLLGWAVAKSLALPPDYAIGLILVGCCPGGTASNLVSYIAKGDVALSVVMTACSTLAAVALTPLFTQWYADAIIPLDGWAICIQTFEVVVLPVLLGVLLNRFAPRLVQTVLPVAPAVSVLAVCAMSALVFAANASGLIARGCEIFLAAFLLHASGFGLGWLFAKGTGMQAADARTISIEVGMQNSGLAIVLAQRSFPGMPLAALVGAVSGVTHSVLGSLLGILWNRFGSPRTSNQ